MRSVEELKNLKGQRRRLNKRISVMEKTFAEEEKARVLKQYYVKIVCLMCNGEGMVTIGGADIESDPPETIPCTDCAGKGFLLARKFDGICKEHKVGYDER